MAKISEVIERLQYIMDIHGDLEMRKWCSGQGYESLVGEVIGISMLSQNDNDNINTIIYI